MSWANGIIMHYPAETNTAFACNQVALGLAISIVLGVLLAGIAVSVYLPWDGVRRGWPVAALVFCAVVRVVVQAFGGVFLSGATDPNTGPLLALLALSFWPIGRSTPKARPAAERAA